MNDKILKFTNNQKGQVALFIVTVVMFLLLFVGLFLTNTTVKQTKITRNVYNSVQAYYLADVGAERVLYELKNGLLDLNIDGPILLSKNVGSDGSFEVEIINYAPLKIKSTGVYKDTARAIELSW